MTCIKHIIPHLSFFFILTYSSNCHSQDLSPKDSLILKQLDTADLHNSTALTTLLKESVLIHAQKMNQALTTYDFETLYTYMPKEFLEGASLEEFVENSQEWKELMMGTVSNQSVIVSGTTLVSHCESGFYCFMNQVTTETMGGKESSRKSRLMAVSQDGIHWIFYNMGTLISEQIKKLYPSVCDEILKN